MSTRVCIPHQHTRRAGRGFTLIELIMVIVMLGVLAVFAAPRMLDSSAFNARGLHDETLAMLRYAQKTAIAQRRTVCVVFYGTVDASCAVTPTTASTAQLCIASAAGATTCDKNLVGPRGETPGTISAKSGAAYSATFNDIHFDGLGQPMESNGVLLSAPRTIQVNGVANTITVEAATGYVHE